MAPLSRARIVDEALRLVERDGYDQLSLRGLAGALGVTAPALYDHVGSKDELLEHVAASGYRLLSDRYADVHGDRAIDRVRTRALAYVEFARDRPSLFQLMFMFRPSAVALDADNELADATNVFDDALCDVRQAIVDGDIVEGDETRLGLLLWAAVHGVATLATYAPPVAESLAGEVVDTFLAGLRPG